MKLLKFIPILVMGLLLTSCYDFNREQNEKDAESNGRAILLEAESSKKAKIEEAKAEKESAELLGQAKVIEAKAKAEASIISSEARAKSIEIESKAVEGKSDYIKFKQVDAMYNHGKFIYVATEAGIPVNEAGRR